MMRLIQITHPAQGRRVARVEGDRCLLLRDHSWEGFGRPLRNPIRFSSAPDSFVRVDPL